MSNSNSNRNNCYEDSKLNCERLHYDITIEDDLVYNKLDKVSLNHQIQKIRIKNALSWLNNSRVLRIITESFSARMQNRN